MPAKGTKKKRTAMLRKAGTAVCLLMVVVVSTWGQKSCKKDSDCGEDAPCCSRCLKNLKGQ